MEVGSDTVMTKERPTRTTPKRSTIYLAVWHDRKRINKIAAERKGDDDEAIFEIAENNESTKGCDTLEQAVSFIVQTIKSGEDFWGQGEVLERERMITRCDACTCQGWQTTHRHIVDDTGIVQTETPESDCYFDD